MPDILDRDGLTIKTLAEIVTELNQAFMNIYGADINLDQNSPDGQAINIFAQQGEDQRELLAQINAGFDPDQAVGVILDQRVAINNIQRSGGTFTTIGITIVTDQTVNLQGLDANFNNINGTGFTIQDNAGNQYILIDSITLTAGTNVVDFRAKQIGQVIPTVNTITNLVTIVLGVVSVNNPSGPLELGSDEETDAELRLRRQKSVALASSGYLNGLLGTVLNLAGVTDAKLYENVTNVTDADGIPAHGIWLIADGGANTDIADAIYNKKSYGANMKGSVVIPIITASGGTFNAKFDRPTSSDLYIQFNIQKTTGTSFDLSAIKTYIANNITYKIGEFADTVALYALALEAMIANGGGGVPTDLQISDDDITYVDFLPTPTKDAEWVVDTTRIAITVLP